MSERKALTDDKEHCAICNRPWLKPCYRGEMEYIDGSSYICPNWNKKLDEIGGMTQEEAEHQALMDMQCR